MRLLLAAFLLAQPLTAAAAVKEPLVVAKGDKKGKKKEKKEGKPKKGGPFTSCAAITTKAECDAHAKDHSCSWDAIAAGGSCGEGAPQ
jgi:hypothetical protein